MKILYIEDTPEKFDAVKRALASVGFRDIKQEKNLEDGLYAIEQSVLSQDKFGVIITDMWYPRESRGAEDQCGLELAATVKEKGYGIPVIIFSNQQYRSEDAIGEVLYGKERNWEPELIALVKQAAESEGE